MHRRFVVSTEKEIMYRQLLVEAESIMMGMFGDLIMSQGFMSDDWKGKITAWLDLKDNV